MNNFLKMGVAALVLVTAFAAPVAAGQFEDGHAAYDKEDYGAAFALWEELAKQGHAPSQTNLGFMLSVGHGVPLDFTEAAKWYRKAAEQNEPKAQLALGHLYSNGDGVPQDYAEALSWFLKAANQSNTNAQISIGSMYSNGDGVPQDYVKAYMWYSIAVAGGDQIGGIIRDSLAAKMTQTQIDEAGKLADDWKPK